MMNILNSTRKNNNMSLFELFESINLQIRQSDYTNSPNEAFIIFKSEFTKNKFKEFMAKIESTLESTPLLSIDTISAYAKELVNKQCRISFLNRVPFALEIDSYRLYETL